MYKNFTIKEFIYSKTAEILCIDNTPDDIILSHLDELITKILQPLRDYYGEEIIVTSGYRCRALNNVVGGVPDSSHLYGYAADVVIKDMSKFDDFVECIKQFVKEYNIAFDQIIIERSGNKRWVHISIRKSNGLQRKLLFNINK